MPGSNLRPNVSEGYEVPALVRKIPFAGIELTSQRVRGLRGTSELHGSSTTTYEPVAPVAQRYLVTLLTSWDVSSSIPANGIFLTKKLRNKIKMPNGWRTIKSLVHKIRLTVDEGKEWLNPSREKN